MTNANNAVWNFYLRTSHFEIRNDYHCTTVATALHNDKYFLLLLYLIPTFHDIESSVVIDQVYFGLP